MFQARPADGIVACVGSRAPRVAGFHTGKKFLYWNKNMNKRDCFTLKKHVLIPKTNMLGSKYLLSY
jgi:hypothetical protein